MLRVLKFATATSQDHSGRPERPGPLWLVRCGWSASSCHLRPQASLTAQRPSLYVRTLEFCGEISIWRGLVSPSRGFLTGLGERGAEIAIGPLFCQRPGATEDDGHGGVTDLQGAEEVGDKTGRGKGKLEDGRVSVLNHDRGVRKGCHLSQRVGQAAVDESAGQVSKAFAFHHGQNVALVLDAVVADGAGTTRCCGLLAGEAERVTLPGVDADDEVVKARCAPGGDPDAGARCPGRLWCLPENPLTALYCCEDDLRAIVAGPVKDQVDGRPAADTRPDGGLVDDLGPLWPVLSPVTVDLGGAGPAVRGF